MVQIDPGVTIEAGVTITGVAAEGPVLDGLLFYWDANDFVSYDPVANAEVINDLSGNNNNGTLFGVDTVTFDPVLPSYTFPGIVFDPTYIQQVSASISNNPFSGLVVLANGAGFQFQTVEVWVKPGSGAVMAPSGIEGEISINIAANTTVYATVYDGAGNIGDSGNLVSITSSITDGEWVQIVMTYDGATTPFDPEDPNANPPVPAAGTLDLYINGSSANTLSIVNGRGAYNPSGGFAPYDPNGGSFYPRYAGPPPSGDLGPGDTGYFDGSIGLVRFYTRTLSPAEILQNYNNDKATYGLS